MLAPPATMAAAAAAADTDDAYKWGMRHKT